MSDDSWEHLEKPHLEFLGISWLPSRKGLVTFYVKLCEMIQARTHRAMLLLESIGRCRFTMEVWLQ